MILNSKCCFFHTLWLSFKIWIMGLGSHIFFRDVLPKIWILNEALLSCCQQSRGVRHEHLTIRSIVPCVNATPMQTDQCMICINWALQRSHTQLRCDSDSVPFIACRCDRGRGAEHRITVVKIGNKGNCPAWGDCMMYNPEQVHFLVLEFPHLQTTAV